MENTTRRKRRFYSREYRTAPEELERIKTALTKTVSISMKRRERYLFVTEKLIAVRNVPTAGKDIFPVRDFYGIDQSLFNTFLEANNFRCKLLHTEPNARGVGFTNHEYAFFDVL